MGKRGCVEASRSHYYETKLIKEVVRVKKSLLEAKNRNRTTVRFRFFVANTKKGNGAFDPSLF